MPAVTSQVLYAERFGISDDYYEIRKVSLVWTISAGPDLSGERAPEGFMAHVIQVVSPDLPRHTWQVTSCDLDSLQTTGLTRVELEFESPVLARKFAHIMQQVTPHHWDGAHPNVGGKQVW